jgi:hypothetical protein
MTSITCLHEAIGKTVARVHDGTSMVALMFADDTYLALSVEKWTRDETAIGIGNGVDIDDAIAMGIATAAEVAERDRHDQLSAEHALRVQRREYDRLRVLFEGETS